MASAVDSRLAYARLSAVATASRLPTATRGSNNSYTTSWDTTAQGIVEFAVGEQAGVGCDPRTVELQLQPSVETGPKWAAIRFTLRVPHPSHLHLI